MLLIVLKQCTLGTLLGFHVSSVLAATGLYIKVHGCLREYCGALVNHSKQVDVVFFYTCVQVCTGVA